LVLQLALMLVVMMIGSGLVCIGAGVQESPQPTADAD
jgi:hypothetical protein